MWLPDVFAFLPYWKKENIRKSQIFSVSSSLDWPFFIVFPGSPFLICLWSLLSNIFKYINLYDLQQQFNVILCFLTHWKLGGNFLVPSWIMIVQWKLLIHKHFLKLMLKYLGEGECHVFCHDREGGNIKDCVVIFEERRRVLFALCASIQHRPFPCFLLRTPWNGNQLQSFKLPWCILCVVKWIRYRNCVLWYDIKQIPDLF